MNQLDEAVARYQKLLETGSFRDLGWAEAMAESMQAGHLTQAGRPICPFLRPNFITRRQYETLVRAAESLFCAIDRVKQMVLKDPALMSRMELLPAEKMLAAVEPGYSYLTVTSLLDTHLDGSAMSFVEYNAESPAGVVYGEALADLFLDSPPVKEFRKRYKLEKLGAKKYLLAAVLKAWKQYGGKTKPCIGILEFRQPFGAAGQGEAALLLQYLRKEGYDAEIVSPDQLEYRAGALRKSGTQIDLIYRRINVREFLLKFDLSHPLVRAYRDRKVCIVNSFRSEIAQKKAIFALLTDEELTASFPTAEKKAIRQYIPWTRMVAAASATYKGETVDLPEFISRNREKLVLKPNDSGGDQHSVHGWEVDDSVWDRALKRALRAPYVVQERVEAPRAKFPIYRYGELETKEVQVDLHPHAYLGKVQGCSTWLTGVNGGGFSTVSGLTPTFLLETKG